MRGTPEQIARDVIRNCISECEDLPVDLHKIAAKFDIRIVFTDKIPSRKVEGISVGRLTDRERMILLPRRRRGSSVVRQNFTLAHELGHIILSENHSGYAGPEAHEYEEKEINRFASELVIPIILLEREWRELPCENFSTGSCSRERCPEDGCGKVKQLARRFGVSLKAMSNKIRNHRHELHAGLKA